MEQTKEKQEEKKGCGKVTNSYYTYAGKKIICGFVFPDGSISYCKNCKKLNLKNISPPNPKGMGIRNGRTI